MQFLRYIPTSPMWVASQMALKSAGGSGREKQDEDKFARSDKEEDATWNTLQSNDSKVLGKYRKAIIDQGFNYFQDEDKLWWIKFFEK